MRISEVLTAKGSAAVHTIAADTTVRDLVDILAEHNIGALVVSDDGTSLAGIVSERDIVRHLHDGPEVLDAPVSTIMTADVQTCSPRDSLDDLARMMTEHRIRHVPVVDDGRLAGILSIGDAVKARMQQLEFERDQLNTYVSGTQ